MTLHVPDPDIMTIEQPYLSKVILIKLYLHSHQIDLVDSLKIKADLIANLQAVGGWTILLKIGIIVSKLLIVKI